MAIIAFGGVKNEVICKDNNFIMVWKSGIFVEVTYFGLYLYFMKTSHIPGLAQHSTFPPGLALKWIIGIFNDIFAIIKDQ